MIPASCIIAFLLLGIEEIGVQIEEPFSILPLGQPVSACFAMLVHFCSNQQTVLLHDCFEDPFSILPSGVPVWFDMFWPVFLL